MAATTSWACGSLCGALPRKTWSTDTVFKRTTEDLERLGSTWEALPELIDIDTEADLEATGLP
ncbi:MAG: hypothetical protein IPI05_16690 [Flavobacteriales bacterium]|nr:hypothetical protein [Flavobacteriales bacterium]